MMIGVDASGPFVAGEGTESSAVAAAVAPLAAREEIAAWTDVRLTAWGREDLGELHAADLGWDGIRSGADILVALALGADAVLGRPPVVVGARGRRGRRRPVMRWRFCATIWPPASRSWVAPRRRMSMTQPFLAAAGFGDLRGLVDDDGCSPELVFRVPGNFGQASADRVVLSQLRQVCMRCS
jgi:hypothetical protein